MTLTLSHGPLSTRAPSTVNYRIDGPAHRLFLDPFPRRVRAELGGVTVLDSGRGMLLHESNLLPQLYVPREDLDGALLTATDRTTHCPFKGDAAYWTVRAGGDTAEDAVWAYPEPLPAASWLAGYAALYWDPFDWYDEDEQVLGHLRDPYHRVDTRRTTRRVRVLADDVLLAETTRAVLLSETGLPNRYYVPEADVRGDLLEPSDTSSVCPYKGTAEYRRLPSGEDVAWSYPEPLDGAVAIAGHWAFDGDGVDVRLHP